jgi:hypothetical protein
MPQKNNTSVNARRAIAARAARVMAEDSVSDFATAKRKAARQLGFADNDALPSNDEVAAELRSYQALYQNDEQRERLALLRNAACALMREFSAHGPHLGGAAWNGTAGRDSGLQLDLFTDNAKAVEMKLLSANTAYRVEQKAHFNAALARRIPVLAFDWHDLPVRLAIYAADDLRGALIADASGAAPRGDLAALEALIARVESTAEVDGFLAAIR